MRWEMPVYVRKKYKGKRKWVRVGMIEIPFSGDVLNYQPEITMSEARFLMSDRTSEKNIFRASAKNLGFED